MENEPGPPAAENHDTLAPPPRKRVLAIVRTTAVMAQLVLAMAVGVAVVVGLIISPDTTAPWALLYLVWCAAILSQIAAGGRA